MPVSCYLCIFLNVGLGEAAKSRVLQSGGDSVKDVMSQNAITYLLSLKAGVNGERVEAENFREALNLGNAALKNTGTGQGQLPDMSAFLSNQEVNGYQGTVAKLAMRQPFVLFKGLTFQKLCLPGAFRPGDHHNKMLRPGLCVVHASPQYL